MKKLFVALVILMLSVASVFAAQPAPPANPYLPELGAAQAEGNKLIAEGEKLDTVGKSLLQAKDNLDFSDKAVDKMKTKWQAEDRALAIEREPLVSQIQSYNAKCKDRVFRFPESQGPPPEYYACQSEMARLAPQKESFDNRMSAHNAQIPTIEENIRLLSENTEKYAAAVKKYNADLEDFNVRKARVIAQLNDIKAKVDSCDKAIASGSNEDMKAICGIAFDGNTSKPSPKLKPKINKMK